MTTKTFLQSRERIKGSIYPLDLYNRKVRSYLEFKTKYPNNCMLIKYEDVLNHEGKLEFLKAINRKYNVSLNEKLNTEVSVKKDNQFEDSETAYKNEMWREQINDEIIKIAEKQIDPTILKYFNYRLNP